MGDARRISAVRRSVSCFVAGSACVAGLAAGMASDPAAALQRAVGAAESSLQKGDLQAAEGHYRAALWEGWLLLARLERHAGQLEPAAHALDKAAAATPAAPEQVFLLATEYLWLNKVEAAERLFAQVARARAVPETRVLIGRSYRDAGEYDRARAALRAALSQDPGVRRAHYYLGMVILADARAAEDRLERAIAEFREELKLEPRDPLANHQLGIALLEADRPAEALPALEAAVRAEPRPLHVYHLGRCQLALDRPAEATASLKRALELAREQAASAAELEKIHYQLGLALRKLGQAQEATSHLAEARRLSAEGREASPAAAAGASDAAGLSAPQRQELKSRLSAVLARAYLNLGIMQARGERHARAAELFEEAAALDPGSAQVQSSLGVAYFNAQAYDRATAPLARARAARPEDAGLKRMLALAWLNTQSYDKAAELLRDDAELGTDPSLRFAYGLALVNSGRAAEAAVHLEAAARVAPEDAGIHYLLGQAYQKLGREEQARQEFELSRRLKEKPPGRTP